MADRITEDWLHLKPYGYAPGDYLSKCRECGSTAEWVDKRAVRCRPCAEAAYALASAAPAPSPASPEQVEALLRVAPHFPGGETPEPSLSALIYRYYRMYFDQPKADDFAKQYLAALQKQGESDAQ